MMVRWCLAIAPLPPLPPSGTSNENVLYFTPGVHADPIAPATRRLLDVDGRCGGLLSSPVSYCWQW